MIRYVLFGASFISVFWFPYPYTLILSFIASALFPPWALFIGLFSDLLYMPSGGWPVASATGALLTLVSVFVHRFIKARIMSQ